MEEEGKKMSEETNMTEIVQFKAEDASVYERKNSEALAKNNAVNMKDIWSDDVSEFESDLAQDLLRIIVEQEKPLTICLNGKWGTGKTFFLTRLVETYKESGGTALYYNAWQDDFLDDPLVSIIAQLGKMSIAEKAFDNVKAVAKPLLAGMGWGLVWGLTKKVAGQVVKNKLGLDVSDLSITDADAINGRDALDVYMEMDASRTELRKAISNFARKTWEARRKPLLFVIDELDRCRPTFAIEVLERVKHLFSVDHLVFIMGTDKSQLSESIRSVYGTIDVQDYLNRFFDLELHLSEVPCNVFVDRLWERIGYERLVPSKSSQIWKEFLEMFKDIAYTSRLSLRQVEQCVRLLPFVWSQLNRQKTDLEMCCQPLLAAGLILKVVDNELFHDFLRCDAPIHRILNVLFKGRGNSWESKHSELFVRILYGVFHEFEGHKHDIHELVYALTSRGRVGLGDIAIKNAKGELPAFMGEWPEDSIKKFYHDVQGLLIHKDKVELGIKNPSLTLNVLRCALMLA